mmetsp:Transcript_8239/g.24738  ORF Transcript_8239/g.24738 Transcript_8239/m.24738 type:complete len:294 (+) Transcript_8239:177-1058(+)|eukprot:scaffold106629_cov43-Tisochrysis_lutea.AAC.1
MGKGKTNPKEYFLAGGAAGIISRTCIAPIERVKILYQVQSGASIGPAWYQLPGRILREEGVQAFWKGNTAAVVRVMPYMSFTFLSFEEYKARIAALGAPSHLCNLAAGSCAGITAVGLTYPLDLVRATMAKPGSKYDSLVGALMTISRERGVLALYSGMTATMMGVAPYAGLKFMTYESFKEALSTIGGISESDLSATQRVAAGAVAGLVAQTFVYPFDVVRRRMQTYDGPGKLYKSALDGLRTIAREEGVTRGLYRGLSLNYLKTMPNVAIYMSLYDIFKKQLVGSPIVKVS